MGNFPNFYKICDDFLNELSPRQEGVILRRFGLKSGNGETLESIGKSYNITRERVRQIEKDSFEKMNSKVEKHNNVFSYLVNYFKKHGELKREDILFFQLANQKLQPHLNFLLTINQQFSKFSDSQEFHPLWTTNPASLRSAKKLNNTIISKLKKKGTSLPFSAILKFLREDSGILVKNIDSQTVLSCIEISKRIKKGMNNKFGLIEWPEINPRGIKDRAFLVLKKERKPLHFNIISSFISKLPFSEKPEEKERKIVSQTVHNELIKDKRFVLVGRGMYALLEWGYEPGVVKDIIVKLLKEKGRPMSRREIIKETLRQRLVKESTVLLNLNNKDYFLKTPKEKYILRKS